MSSRPSPRCWAAPSLRNVICRLVPLALLGLLPRTARAVDEAEILAAVRASFDAYEQLPCVGVHFEYKGEPPALATEEPGAIVVWFAGSDIPWTAGTKLFDGTVFTGNAQGELTTASLGVNSKDFAWSLDGAAGTYDIQTVLMRQLSNMLGFCVTEVAHGCSFTPQPGIVDRTLPEQYQQGVTALYYSESANGCSEAQPPEPTSCSELEPLPDAGVGDLDGGVSAQTQLCVFRSPADAPPFHWPDTTISYYVSIPADGKLPGGSGGGPVADGGVGDGGGSSTDGGGFVGCSSDGDCATGEICTSQGVCINQSGGDGGCCRIHRAHSENLVYGTLVVLGLALFLARQRRRRHRG